MNDRTIRLAALSLLACASGCSSEEASPEAPRPRPVRVLELAESDPAEPLKITGVTKAWNDADVAFEVDGRIEFIVEAGTNLEGRWIEDGEIRIEGDVLARLDDTEYQVRLEQAKASVRVAERELAAAKVEEEKVLPANLAAARAERDRANAEFERSERAFAKNAISEVDLIRARADRDARDANYAQAEAAFETQKARIESLTAALNRARQDEKRAQLDLDRCTLYSPFQGEVATVYVEAGGYARRGEGVAHVSLLNVLKIDVSVSRATAAKLQIGQLVRLYPPDAPESIEGTIYEKSTTADAETRTFRVSIVTRNTRSVDGIPAGDSRLNLPRIGETWRLERFDLADPTSPFGVEERRALHRGADGNWFVWAVDLDPDDEMDLRGHAVTLRRYEVVPGDFRRSYQGIYLVRSLRDIGELKERMMIALDVPSDFRDGGQVLVARERWKLTPGTLVDVLLDADLPSPGLYVPMSAVRPDSERRGFVFLAVDQQVRQVAVEIENTTRDLAKIRPIESDTGLETGALLIVDHVHFLQPGEPVSVVRSMESAR